MPRLDKTGPEGKGSKTGRGLGNCKSTRNEDQPRGWRRTRLGRSVFGRQNRFWNREEDQNS